MRIGGSQMRKINSASEQDKGLNHFYNFFAFVNVTHHNHATQPHGTHATLLHGRHATLPYYRSLVETNDQPHNLID